MLRLPYIIRHLGMDIDEDARVTSLQCSRERHASRYRASRAARDGDLVARDVELCAA